MSIRYSYTSNNKEKYIKDKIKVLLEFNIAITPEIEKKIEELYPNDIAIENYTRSIILHSFRDYF